MVNKNFGTDDRIRTREQASGHFGLWGHIQSTAPFATQGERLFASVHETKRCCKTCLSFHVWYSWGYVWHVPATEIAGGLLMLAGGLPDFVCSLWGVAALSMVYCVDCSYYAAASGVAIKCINYAIAMRAL